MSVRLETSCARRWSTDEVEQRQALAYWVDTVCDRFLALDIDTPVREHFRARLEQVDLGPATVNFIDAGSQRVFRTHAKIVRSDDPVFLLMQLRMGQVRLRQLGRDVIVRPGECVFVDGMEPYRLECPEPTSALALRMPAAWLTRWIPRPEHVTTRLFTGGGWNAALNAALASLDVESRGELALPPGAVAEQIAALLALAVGRESVAPGSASLFDELVRTLRDRLHETELSPDAVADQHRISKRTLHYAFASASTTFSEQLMRLRLECARDMLSDVRLARLPVAEVAARCGFLDPSHFARRFRQRFAQAPAQFRNTALGTKH